MKLFISQPMKDKTNEEIEAERAAAVRLFDFPGLDLEVINSFFKDAPAQATPLWFLGESIELLGKADVAYFCKDWQHYNGCIIEHECAVRYGKKILYA
nr:MAG TPA: protein of unknown function DUF4406 [Bacteriophage sp.]